MDIHNVSQGLNVCSRYGGKHDSNSCRCTEEECFYCKKTSHIMRVCRKKAKPNKTQVRKRMGEYSTNNVACVQTQLVYLKAH